MLTLLSLHQQDTLGVFFHTYPPKDRREAYMTRPENPELIAAIRKAVLELTAKKDPSAVTMREIAAACGVTPTTIYYYFKNKGRLFEAVKFDIIDDLDTILTAAYNRDDPVKKQLTDLMRAFIGWYIENPRMADLVFDKLTPATDLTEERLARYYKANRHAYEIISRGKQTGEFVVEDAGDGRQPGAGLYVRRGQALYPQAPRTPVLERHHAAGGPGDRVVPVRPHAPRKTDKVGDNRHENACAQREPEKEG